MDWKLNSDKEVKTLMLVAHPDDETIFGGGVMLSNPSWLWTVVCVTMQAETNRHQEFERAIIAFQKAGVRINSFLTLNKRDANQQLSEEEKRDWRESVAKLDLSPDIVFTHSEVGEYGHNHHIHVSSIANNLFPNVWNFVYPGGIKIGSTPTKDLVNEVSLVGEIIKAKKAIFDEAYAVQAPGLWQLLGELMDYEFNKGPEFYTSNG